MWKYCFFHLGNLYESTFFSPGYLFLFIFHLASLIITTGRCFITKTRIEWTKSYLDLLNGLQWAAISSRKTVSRIHIVFFYRNIWSERLLLSRIQFFPQVFSLMKLWHTSTTTLQTLIHFLGKSWALNLKTSFTRASQGISSAPVLLSGNHHLYQVQKQHCVHPVAWKNSESGKDLIFLSCGLCKTSVSILIFSIFCILCNKDLNSETVIF